MNVPGFGLRDPFGARHGSGSAPHDETAPGSRLRAAHRQPSRSVHAPGEGTADERAGTSPRPSLNVRPNTPARMGGDGALGALPLGTLSVGPSQAPVASPRRRGVGTGSRVGAPPWPRDQRKGRAAGARPAPPR